MLQTLPITPQPCIDAPPSSAPADATNGDAGAFARALRQAGSKDTTPAATTEAAQPATADKPSARVQARRDDHAARGRASPSRGATGAADDTTPARARRDAAKPGSDSGAFDRSVGEPGLMTRGAAATDDNGSTDLAATALADGRPATSPTPELPAPDGAPVPSMATQPAATDLRRVDDVSSRRPVDEQPGLRTTALGAHGRWPMSPATPTSTSGEVHDDPAVAAVAGEAEHRREPALAITLPTVPASARERDAAGSTAAATALPSPWLDAAPTLARESAVHPMASAALGAAVGSREFAEAFGSQVVLWVRDGVQEARLQLHPAELGPVSIQITLDGAAAQVDFHAAHAQTREAIEASLPALASALRESGFTLSGGGVFGQSAGGDPGARATPQGEADARRAGGANPLPGDATAAPELHARPWRRGLLDVFA